VTIQSSDRWEVPESPEVTSWQELERKWFHDELPDDWCEYMRSTVVERLEIEFIFSIESVKRP